MRVPLVGQLGRIPIETRSSPFSAGCITTEKASSSMPVCRSRPTLARSPMRAGIRRRLMVIRGLLFRAPLDVSSTTTVAFVPVDREPGPDKLSRVPATRVNPAIVAIQQNPARDRAHPAGECRFPRVLGSPGSIPPIARKLPWDRRVAAETSRPTEHWASP